MRDIIFRGKRIDNGEWIYGLPYERLGEIQSIRFQTDVENIIGHTVCTVIPSTIGQYTGLTDKNGKRIFEGDIVKVKYTFNGEDCEEIKPVTYDPKNGGYVPFTWEYQCDGCDCEVTIVETEIIGNIHDNKEFDA